MSSTVPAPAIPRPVQVGSGAPDEPGAGLSDGTVQC
jgi:hypothetical protein